MRRKNSRKERGQSAHDQSIVKHRWKKVGECSLARERGLFYITEAAGTK